MRAYILTTGVIFGIVTLAHVWRMIEEKPMATEPWYILITVATGALCLWAWRVLRRTGRS